MTASTTAVAADSAVIVGDEKSIVSACYRVGGDRRVRCVGSSRVVRGVTGTSTLDAIEPLAPCTVSVASAIDASVVRRFPHSRDNVLVPELIMRALRLSCLTAAYGPFWSELFDRAWTRDDLPVAPPAMSVRSGHHLPRCAVTSNAASRSSSWTRRPS